MELTLRVSSTALSKGAAYTSRCPVSSSLVSAAGYNIFLFSVTVTTSWPSFYPFLRCLWASNLLFFLLPHHSSAPVTAGSSNTNSASLFFYLCYLTTWPETSKNSFRWHQTSPRIEHDFLFLQIMEKPLKMPYLCRETQVPLKNIAPDTLCKNKVIKLGLLWSLSSSGLTDWSLQSRHQKHFIFSGSG